MDVTWFPTTDGYVKINIHTSERQIPLPNGNSNGLGVIIRDAEGKMLWGGMGPIPNSGFLLTQLKGMHVAAVKAYQLGNLKTHIETDSQWVFESFRDQDEIIFEEETKKILGQLNTLHANHFEIGVSDRRVTCIIPEMNMAAIYLAEYGMEHLNAFYEITEVFGNLQNLLDEDMGIGVHLSIPNIHSFLGMGEVFDASPPPTPVCVSEETTQDDISMCEDTCNVIINMQCHVNIDLGKMEEDTPLSKCQAMGEEWARILKGKEKVLVGYKFNDNGLLSQKAIEVLKSGSLSSIAKGFKNDVINLEEMICEGVFMKDVLESAVCGSLEELVNKIAKIGISNKGVELENKPGEPQSSQGDLMDVEKALLELFNFDEPMQE